MPASARPDRCWRSRRSEAGYSLLETLIALFVVAIGIFAVLDVLVNIMNTSNLSHQRSLATHYAEKLVETQVRNQDWAELGDTTDNTDSELQGALGPNATWDLVVKDIGDSLKGITITVKWQGARKPDGQGWFTEQVALSTVAHPDGIGAIRGRYVNVSEGQ